jgi:hypothetical protein
MLFTGNVSVALTLALTPAYPLANPAFVTHEDATASQYDQFCDTFSPVWDAAENMELSGDHASDMPHACLEYPVGVAVFTLETTPFAMGTPFEVYRNSAHAFRYTEPFDVYV